MAESHGQHQDALWEDFERTADPLEREYLAIEELNEILIRMVAGAPLTTQQLQIAKMADLGIKINGNLKEAVLFLRPDHRMDLVAQGLPKEEAELQGNPHLIVGDVPERTATLVKDLLTKLGASYSSKITRPGPPKAVLGNIDGAEVEILFQKLTTTAAEGFQIQHWTELAVYAHSVLPPSQEPQYPKIEIETYPNLKELAQKYGSKILSFIRRKHN
jgi:hypothetical protein